MKKKKTPLEGEGEKDRKGERKSHEREGVR